MATAGVVPRCRLSHFLDPSRSSRVILRLDTNHGLLLQTPVDGLTHRGTPELGGELRITSVRYNLTTLRLPHRFHQRPTPQPSMRLSFINFLVD
jgi:hypothetical protein